MSKQVNCMRCGAFPIERTVAVQLAENSDGKWLCSQCSRTPGVPFETDHSTSTTPSGRTVVREDDGSIWAEITDGERRVLEGGGQFVLDVQNYKPPLVARWKHSCDDCKLVSQVGTYDLYVCEHDPNVIIRWGEGRENRIGLPKGVLEAALAASK